jgi:hypothetical protein
MMLLFIWIFYIGRGWRLSPKQMLVHQHGTKLHFLIIRWFWVLYHHFTRSLKLLSNVFALHCSVCIWKYCWKRVN